jgi:predicted nucleic acid-binding protein
VRLPLRRFELLAVASRTWQLRDNLTPYDASYAALAELLSAPLVTSARLARGTGPRCIIELIRGSPAG